MGDVSEEFVRYLNGRGNSADKLLWAVPSFRDIVQVSNGRNIIISPVVLGFEKIVVDPFFFGGYARGVRSSTPNL